MLKIDYLVEKNNLIFIIEGDLIKETVVKYKKEVIDLIKYLKPKNIKYKLNIFNIDEAGIKSLIYTSNISSI